MLRRALPALLVVAVVALGAWHIASPNAYPPAEPAPHQGELARFLPLVAGAEGQSLDFDWLAGEARSIVVRREISGWEQVAGHPHARVVYRRDLYRGEELYLVEWLRPDGEQIVCSAREVAEHRYRLDPPQPILRLPLSPGQSWTWTGTVDGVEATATFEVVSRRDETDGERLQVRSITNMEGQTTEQVTSYAAGQGPIAATGVMPRGDLKIEQVGFEADPYQE